MDDNLMALLQQGSSEDFRKTLVPQNEFERDLADFLQRMLVDKRVPEPVMVAALFAQEKDENGDTLMKVMSLGAEHLSEVPTEEVVPYLVLGTKTVGPPRLSAEDREALVGMVYITTGCRLLEGGEVTEAYMEMKKYGLEVWMQDFPGAQKTRMAMFADGKGRLVMATMYEDDDGIQSFEQSAAGDIIKNLDVTEEPRKRGMGGRIAEALDELASLFRGEV